MDRHCAQKPRVGFHRLHGEPGRLEVAPYLDGSMNTDGGSGIHGVGDAYLDQAVPDMYEHSYHMDYGSGAGGYSLRDALASSGSADVR